MSFKNFNAYRFITQADVTQAFIAVNFDDSDL